MHVGALAEAEEDGAGEGVQLQEMQRDEWGVKRTQTWSKAEDEVEAEAEAEGVAEAAGLPPRHAALPPGQVLPFEEEAEVAAVQREQAEFLAALGLTDADDELEEGEEEQQQEEEEEPEDEEEDDYDGGGGGVGDEGGPDDGAEVAEASEATGHESEAGQSVGRAAVEPSLEDEEAEIFAQLLQGSGGGVALPPRRAAESGQRQQQLSSPARCKPTIDVPLGMAPPACPLLMRGARQRRRKPTAAEVAAAAEDDDDDDCDGGGGDDDDELVGEGQREAWELGPEEAETTEWRGARAAATSEHSSTSPQHCQPAVALCSSHGAREREAARAADAALRVRHDRIIRERGKTP